MGSPPRGAPAFKGRIAAYKEFCVSTWWAHHQFSEAGDGGVEGAMLACQAAARLIAVRHENPELAAPFLSLHQALGDLQKGVVPELLSIDKTDRERSRSSQKKHIRTFAAVCLEVLMKSGDSEQQAAELVARRVQKWPGVGRQEIKTITVINWRKTEHALEAPKRRPFEAIRDDILGQSAPRALVMAFLKHGPPGNPKS